MRPAAPDRSAAAAKEANRRYYDLLADRYEAVDGRRSPDLERWLRGRLAGLREAAPGGTLLDLGAGSGFASRCAAGIFESRTGIDISAKILAQNRDAFDAVVAADLDHVPLPGASFDAVVCFAVLHHLPDHEALAAEVARLLRPGGVFYADHDLDAVFYRRWRPLMSLYRRLADHRRRALRACPELTGEVYDQAEHHASGIDAAAVAGHFSRRGFRVALTRHWYGLNGACNRVFGARAYPAGWAPLVSVVATAPRDAAGTG